MVPFWAWSLTLRIGSQPVSYHGISCSSSQIFIRRCYPISSMFNKHRSCIGSTSSGNLSSGRSSCNTIRLGCLHSCMNKSITIPSLKMISSLRIKCSCPRLSGSNITRCYGISPYDDIINITSRITRSRKSKRFIKKLKIFQFVSYLTILLFSFSGVLRSISRDSSAHSLRFSITPLPFPKKL